jgi:hypothetical protein
MDRFHIGIHYLIFSFPIIFYHSEQEKKNLGAYNARFRF